MGKKKYIKVIITIVIAAFVLSFFVCIATGIFKFQPMNFEEPVSEPEIEEDKEVDAEAEEISPSYPEKYPITAAEESQDLKEEKAETLYETEYQIMTWAKLMDIFLSGSGRVMLPQVIGALDGENIQYTGYYNQSLERIDMTLEDGTALLFLRVSDSEGKDMGYELMMVNEQLNSNGFQEDYLNEYDVTTDEFYYPDLSERLWEYDELRDFDVTELSIARNQIYAKHGREFQDLFLRGVFERKSWYHAKITADEFSKMQQDILTDIERENLETISQLEVNWGIRKKKDDDFEYVKRLLSGSWLDLDGDGEKEQIIYEVMKEDNTGVWAFDVELKIIGDEEGEVIKDLHGQGLWTECFVASTGDQYTYLIVSDIGDSLDYVSTFYQYEKGILTEVGSMRSHPLTILIYPDKIIGEEREQHFQTQEIEREFVFEDGALIRQEKDYYEYMQNIVIAKEQIDLYSEKGGKDAAITLSEGDKVQVMGGDLEQWVQLKKVSTGEAGWLRTNEYNNCYLPDGSEISVWCLFDDIIAYD